MNRNNKEESSFILINKQSETRIPIDNSATFLNSCLEMEQVANRDYVVCICSNLIGLVRKTIVENKWEADLFSLSSFEAILPRSGRENTNSLFNITLQYEAEMEDTYIVTILASTDGEQEETEISREKDGKVEQLIDGIWEPAIWGDIDLKEILDL